ncbi:hypothetical protein BV25DRAFT_1833487 [Artomyces pyxidatus]|uniref:Uncharacterized protein n=1 Tax=Artomyces pyxidatus TaxID=48021 RepID=A0ACB8SF95_9AGAM|nr:hypothetical protein BV25DRAFT_1833487 [Artomyces pyxidatus]
MIHLPLNPLRFFCLGTCALCVRPASMTGMLRSSVHADAVSSPKRGRRRFCLVARQPTLRLQGPRQFALNVPR